MNINHEIARLDHAINQLASTEAKIKAQRMELTALRDERKRQRQIIVEHVVDLISEPDMDDIAEADEMFYGGQSPSEAYRQHVLDSMDDFDIEQGADLS